MAKDRARSCTPSAPLPCRTPPIPQPAPRTAEILGLLGLLASAAGPDITGGMELPADRAAWVVRDQLENQPGCAHPVSDGFAVSLIAPVLLTARHDPGAALRYLGRAAAWTADRYDPELGGIGLADASAGTVDEVAHLLGDAFENAPPRRSGSYAATVPTDLAAVILGGGSLYGDLVNDFLAADLPRAGAGLIRGDLREVRGADVRRRSGGVVAGSAVPVAASCRSCPAAAGTAEAIGCLRPAGIRRRQLTAQGSRMSPPPKTALGGWRSSAA